MIRIESLAHVGIRITDFARSVAFYRQFGFKVTRDDRHEHVVVLHHPSGLELNLLDSADDDNHGRNILMDETPRCPGVTHVAWRIEDVRYARARLEAAGVTITEGPVSFGNGSTSIFFRDPDRNVIELAEPLHGRSKPVESQSGSGGRRQ